MTLTDWQQHLNMFVGLPVIFKSVLAVPLRAGPGAIGTGISDAYRVPAPRINSTGATRHR